MIDLLIIYYIILDFASGETILIQHSVKFIHKIVHVHRSTKKQGTNSSLVRSKHSASRSTKVASLCIFRLVLRILPTLLLHPSAPDMLSAD